jgi:UPF0755 protein
MRGPAALRGRVRWLGLVVAMLVAAGAAAGAVAWWLSAPLELRAETAEVSIEPGSSAREVARAWTDAGVLTSPRLLYEWFRWSGEARRIRAGTYVITRGTTPRQLLDKLVRGDEVLVSVRLIEGWTFRQVRAELARAESLRPASAGMSDTQVMEAIGAAGVVPEGNFFPDTYAYARGVSDLAVLRRSYQVMQRQIEAAWAQRDADTPLASPQEALILASIVEKETGRPEDRSLVAGVFVNRLRKGMLLQTDPAVIYGLGEAFDGNLRKRDLQTDGPYNTYTRPGLPPTPIAMPGRASLLAAVKPQPTKALYFVARGDGTSQFSETLAEHNRAVDRFQRGR